MKLPKGLVKKMSLMDKIFHNIDLPTRENDSPDPSEREVLSQQGFGEDVFVDRDPVIIELRDKWLETMRSVGPSSPDKRVEVLGLVKKLYASRSWKLPPDECVVYSPSPFVTMVSAGLLTAYWSSRNTNRTLPKRRNDNAAVEQICKTIPNWIGNEARMLIYAPVSAASMKLRLMISSATDLATDLMAEVIASNDTMFDTLKASVRSKKVSEAVARICRDCAGDDILNFSPSTVVEEIGLEETIELIGKTLGVMEGGNLNCGVASFIDYLERKKNVVVSKEFSLQAEISSRVGPWVMHPRFCIVGEFPELLKVNDSGQLHSEDGPACRWSDETRIYCLKGVRVGSMVVEDPESTTVEHLEKMTSPQKAVCFDKAPKREQVLFAIHSMEDEEDWPS